MNENSTYTTSVPVINSNTEETDHGILAPADAVKEYKARLSEKYAPIKEEIAEGLLAKSTAKAVETDMKLSALSVLYHYSLVESIKGDKTPKNSEELYQLLNENKKVLPETVKKITYKLLVNELNKDLDGISIKPQDNFSIEHYEAVSTLALTTYGFNMKEFPKTVAEDPSKALEVFKDEAEQSPLRAGYQHLSSLLGYSVPNVGERIDLLSKMLGTEINDEQEGINKVAQKIRAELMSITDRAVALNALKGKVKPPVQSLISGKTLDEVLAEEERRRLKEAA